MTNAFMICVYLISILLLGRRSHADLSEMMRLRFEREALNDDLRREKDQAEQANRSKSRFLASASHDLRQPVHALSMFAGALFNHPMNSEVRRIAVHIENSVRSLEDLFGSLLDVSRLDAGVVEAEARSFPIGPLLERVCSEFAAVSEQKGLLLQYCATGAWVRSDPVLLERIVRNIVSNAVRYTDKGRILVGCRRGARVRLQVWDTGRGIARTELQHVFEEFYQIGNTERDRSQGLGLGLAIVKRLTALLDHPLDVKSTPGRGTGFTLSLPSATSSPGAREAPAVPLYAVSLGGAIVHVIDDDRAVLESMRGVLTGWGAEVVAAQSGAEILKYADNGIARPDIILCDYRLRKEENGIEVIRALQARYGKDVPAVLITADTASDRVKQAHDSEFVVLYKPIAYGKLRALIGNLLRPHKAREQEQPLERLLGSQD